MRPLHVAITCLLLIAAAHVAPAQEVRTPAATGDTLLMHRDTTVSTGTVPTTLTDSVRAHQGQDSLTLPPATPGNADTAARLQDSIPTPPPADTLVRPADSAMITPRADTLTVIAVGDIMLGSDFPPKVLLPPSNNAYALLAPAVPIFQRGHVVFGNLEGAFLDGGKPYKSCSNPDKCYRFRMPTHLAPALKQAGFNAISLANNHVGDFGPPAQQCTMRLLDSMGIAHAGLLAHPVDTLYVQGYKIGLCAFAPNSGTNQLNNYTTLRKTVNDLKAKCDIVIASCHMGAEGATHTHITRAKELYLGENRGNPHEIARVLIDAGADLVLGHGPHVTRAIDLYQGRFIVYSMGNFCTYGGINLLGPGGLAPIMEIRIDGTGKFISATIHSTRQQGRGGVQLDPNRAVLREIRKLTAQDLPQAPIHIDEEGLVTPKM